MKCLIVHSIIVVRYCDTDTDTDIQTYRPTDLQSYSPTVLQSTSVTNDLVRPTHCCSLLIHGLLFAFLLQTLLPLASSLVTDGDEERWRERECV